MISPSSLLESKFHFLIYLSLLPENKNFPQFERTIVLIELLCTPMIFELSEELSVFQRKT